MKVLQLHTSSWVNLTNLMLGERKGRQEYMKYEKHKIKT